MAGPLTSLTGKVVVVTGTLSVERDVMKSMLRKAGAVVHGSVSKKTQFLVVGSRSGSKLEKARALGIATLTEDAARKAMKA